MRCIWAEITGQKREKAEKPCNSGMKYDENKQILQGKSEKKQNSRVIPA